MFAGSPALQLRMHKRHTRCHTTQDGDRDAASESIYTTLDGRGNQMIQINVSVFYANVTGFMVIA